MEQTKALNALEPFLILTKSATSPRAAADLVTRATSAPNTFVFAELLYTPQIQALSDSPEYAAHYELLRTFCYGTYDSYKKSPNLPPLNEAQTLKLRQLSILTLASDSRNLTYQNLISLLGLEDARALEKLVISTIYAGLISGTLDPYNQRITISGLAPLRDVSPDAIPWMRATLKEWSGRCDAVLENIEAQIEAIKANAARRRKTEREWEQTWEKLVSEETDPATNDNQKKPSGRRGDKRGFLNRGPGAVDDGEMDIDDIEEEVEKRGTGNRSLKKRGLGGLSFKH